MQLNIGKCQKTPNEKKILVNKTFSLVEHPRTNCESCNKSGVLARIKHTHDKHLLSLDSPKKNIDKKLSNNMTSEEK